MLKQQERLLALLVLLQERRHCTSAELAQHFGVSVRTVLRDVAALAAVDVPVFTERGRYGGIVLLPGAGVDVARLGPAEAEVLQLLGRDLDAARQLGLDRAAQRLLTKAGAARRAAPTAGDSPGLPLAEVVTIDHRGWFVPSAQVDVAALAANLRRGVRLEVEYRSSGQPSPRWRVVDPYGLLLRAGRWYLVGDHDGDPHLYAVSRISGWRATGVPRRVRQGVTLPALARELSDRLESTYDVVVTAEVDAGRRDLVERVLGSRLISARVLEDSQILQIEVGYAELGGVRQLLQFADHLRVLAPPEAQSLVHSLASGLADRHSQWEEADEEEPLAETSLVQPSTSAPLSDAIGR